MGKNLKKSTYIYTYIYRCVYIRINHFAVYLKLTQYCVLTVLQQKENCWEAVLGTGDTGEEEATGCQGAQGQEDDDSRETLEQQHYTACQPPDSHERCQRR